MATVTVSDGTDPSAADVLRELMRLGLVTAQQAVEEGLTVTEFSVSHTAYRVDVGGRAHVFVKKAAQERSGGRDLTIEAALYRLVGGAPTLAGVVPYPRHISGDDSTIVTDAVAATPLQMEALFAADAAVRRGLLTAYGAAVAAVHRVRRLPPLGESPWMLTALEPGWGDYAWLPSACRRLLRRLAAEPAFVAGFRSARGSWRRSCLVHGDLRGANVLVADPGAAEPPQLWLVDWELACQGDPAWDLGCVIADLLAAAILGGRPRPRQELVESWRWFLLGYHGPHAANRDRLLLTRSARMAGVRLVGVLVELAHVSESETARASEALLPSALDLLSGTPWLAERPSPPPRAAVGA